VKEGVRVSSFLFFRLIFFKYPVFFVIEITPDAKNTPVHNSQWRNVTGTVELPWNLQFLRFEPD